MYKFVEKLGTKYVESFGGKVLWNIVLKNWLEDLGGTIGWKEWVKNVVENSLEKVVGKIG